MVSPTTNKDNEKLNGDAAEIDLKPPLPLPWHSQAVDEVLAGTLPDSGLSWPDAAARLERYGPNELVERGTRKPWQILWEQLTAVMVLILLAASVLSFFMGKYLEASAILAIVVLFVTLGFIQEYRAEKAIAALKKLAVPNVKVYRESKLVEIAAPELVPGDIVSLEAGNLVPADLRIIESANLQIQEAALTGESQPVEKTTAALPDPNLSLAERYNMAYMGTLVSYGRGRAVVVETGMRTELGKIAGLLQSLKPETTPLQNQLDRVGKQLALAGVACALLIIFLGVSAGENLTDMILTGISLAVAIIPEGLPAVVTVTLALGAQRMLRRNALIRKLPAVETLGSVTTICSDKTGTLTQNKMTVTVIDVAGHHLALSEQIGEGQDTTPQPAAVTMVLAGGALCNDARLQSTGEAESELIGDPTETALLAAGNRAGLDLKALAEAMPRVGELPFDSVRKRMTTVHKRPLNSTGQPACELKPWCLSGLDPQLPYLGLTKGSVDGLLEISAFVWDGGKVLPLRNDHLARILAASNQLACDGMRVLGLAFKFYDHTSLTLADETSLVFFGLVGMVDPPRPEVRQAVQECKTAGIRPILITGDHPLTAGYIARELGISGPDGRVVTGAELDHMEPAELEETVRQAAVFARVVPEHKLKIVEALQKQGQVVAMTGDGVNDAPALKRADIGVAMGLTGTDVSKEAADMVLRDDNFTTIVAAVEEGRVIYDNLRRFIGFAVAGNIGKVIIMLFWPLPFVLLALPLHDKVAFLPLQLLWLNLMTDGLLGLSMGFEKAEKDVMRRPPRSPKDGIFTGGLGWQVSGIGLFIGLVGLGIGFLYYREGLGYWQSMLFNTAAFLQIFQALATRSTRDSLFSIGVFTNRWMWVIIGLVSLGQTLAIYSPVAAFFGLKPLPLFDFGLSVLLGSSLLVAVELEKYVLRRLSARKAVV